MTTPAALAPHIMRDLIAKCSEDAVHALMRTATLADLPDDVLGIIVTAGAAAMAVAAAGIIEKGFGADPAVARKIAGVLMIAQGRSVLGSRPERLETRVRHAVRIVAGEALAQRLDFRFR